MLKLFFLSLTVVIVTASSNFPTTAYNHIGCGSSLELARCVGAITELSTLGYDQEYACSLFTIESKCFQNYCSTAPAYWISASSVLQSNCETNTSPSKPTPNLPKAPSEASATTTTQASANTGAPAAKGTSLETTTTSPSSTATASSKSSASAGSQNASISGASSVSFTAKPTMGALAVMFLLWKFM